MLALRRQAVASLPPSRCMPSRMMNRMASSMCALVMRFGIMALSARCRGDQALVSRKNRPNTTRASGRRPSPPAPQPSELGGVVDLAIATDSELRSTARWLPRVALGGAERAPVDVVVDSPGRLHCISAVLVPTEVSASCRSVRAVLGRIVNLVFARGLCIVIDAVVRHRSSPISGRLVYADRGS